MTDLTPPFPPDAIPPDDGGDHWMLSAYLDDELTADERALVEARLVDSEEWRAELDEVRVARDAVRALDLRVVPDGFWDEVDAAVADAPDLTPPGVAPPGPDPGADVSVPAAATVTSLDEQRDRRRSRRRIAAWAAGGVAAAFVFGAMFVIPGRHQVRPNVAAVVTHHGATEREPGRPAERPRTSRADAELAVRSTSVSGRALSVAVVVVLALAGMIGLDRRADAASRDAARVVEQMRSAADDLDFTATAEVTWHSTSGAPRHATVSVRAADGALQVTSADEVVLDEQGHTFVKDDLGWWTPAKEPGASRQPAPDARWHLEARHGTTLGRPTTTVVASRADGSVAQRLVIDDATHVLIGREVLGRDGTRERGFHFTAMAVTPSAGAQVITASPSASARDATAVRDVADEFHAPSVIGSGFQLVSRARHGDGVRLVYSDGLFTMTVVEQSGELDWSALPDGGASTSVEGARARRYAQPLGDVVVWQRDDVVFTCVSDAPRDSYVGAIDGISSGPGVVERVVDFVLAPFSFD